jgi:DNA polymerase-1
LDTETTGLSPHKDRIRLLTLDCDTTDGGRFTYVVDCEAVDPAPLWEALAEKTIIGHNVAFDLAFLAARGFSLYGLVRDTMIMSQLLHGTRRPKGFHGLGAVVQREMGQQLDKTEQKSDWVGTLTPDQLAYAAGDAAVLLPLFTDLETKIKEAGLEPVAMIESGALPAVSWMGQSGVGFDRDAWDALAREAAEKAEQLALQLDACAPQRPGKLPMGGAWNWSSPVQVKAVFAALGIDLKSTDDDAMAAVDHPLASLLREYRSVTKLATTYGPRWYAGRLHAGRLYAGWRQIGADSGRMACGNPNLQNMPRDPHYRKCIVAPPGRILVKADYSQIELRIAAKLSEDPAMLDAYVRGEDLHLATARMVLGVENPTKEQRQIAKSLNFGLLYGMGAKGFRQYARSQYGVALSEQEAGRYRSAFFKTYPGLASWHQIVRRLRAAESRTLAGRRRLFDDKAPDTQRLNTPVQGTGADGLKAALALLWCRQDAVPGTFPALAVHDEIVVECPEDRGEEAAAWLKDAMVAAMAPLIRPVPVEVSVKIGGF